MPRRLMLRIPLLALLFGLSSSITWTQRNDNRSLARVESDLRVTRGVAGGLDYFVVEPPDLPPDAELPMVVYIHGRGDRPRIPRRSIYDLHTPVRLILPRAPDRYGTGWAWMPVSAHDGESAPLVRALDERTKMLTSALAEWRGRYPTRGKPIVVGFSQGAMLAMTLAVREPGAIARAIPMAGWIPPSLVPGRADPYASYAPVTALHGGGDPVLDATRTRRLVEELAELGYPVAYEEFPGVGHEVSPAMYQRFVDLLEAAIRELPDTHESSGSA